jgi:hypothetical protein
LYLYDGEILPDHASLHVLLAGGRFLFRMSLLGITLIVWTGWSTILVIC